MEERIAHLTTFAEAVAAGRPDLFDPTIASAYRAGAELRDLLVAVDVARVLADVPEPVLARAYGSIRAWRWVGAK